MHEAVLAGLEGIHTNQGGPFGCVVVKDDEIVGRGCNRVLASTDPTAHAEVEAIREACKNLGSFQLTGCELYTTCEPCPMCLGAIYWARPDKVYYACDKNDAAEAGFDDSFIYAEIDKPHHHRKIAMQPMNKEEAQELFGAWKNKNNKTLY